MVLGLDISTSCTGLSILKSDGTLYDLQYILLGKNKNLFCKANSVRNSLLKIKESVNIEKIYIEENLQSFRPGLSSAKTLMTLSRFNGIVSFICYDVFNIEPEFLNVNAARKSLDIKIDRKSDLSTKEQILSWAKQKLPDFNWPKRAIKFGSRKGLIINCNECYDMSDAYVISLAGIKTLKNVRLQNS